MKPSYERTGNTFSQLDISQFCGLAPQLGRQYGAGRAAVISRCWHAQCAGQPEATRLFVQLTDREREAMRAWGRPVTVRTMGVVLDYESAEKEVWAALDEWGFAVEPKDGATVLCVGQLDFGWVRESKGHKIAYVGDLKASLNCLSADPESLQVHGYGIAYAQLRGCTHYTTGIWGAEQGEWKWSSRVIELGSPEYSAILERVIAAASNTAKVGSLGSHCSECWSRLHCPEYTLPESLAGTELEPVAQGVMPDPAKAARLLMLCKRAEDVADKCKEQLKAWVSSGKLRVVNEDGTMEWRLVEMPGRTSVSLEDMRSAGIDLKPFEKKGQPYSFPRWCKVGKQ